MSDANIILKRKRGGKWGRDADTLLKYADIAHEGVSEGTLLPGARTQRHQGPLQA